MLKWLYSKSQLRSNSKWKLHLPGVMLSSMWIHVRHVRHTHVLTLWYLKCSERHIPGPYEKAPWKPLLLILQQEELTSKGESWLLVFVNLASLAGCIRCPCYCICDCCNMFSQLPLFHCHWPPLLDCLPCRCGKTWTEAVTVSGRQYAWALF